MLCLKQCKWDKTTITAVIKLWCSTACKIIQKTYGFMERNLLSSFICKKHLIFPQQNLLLENNGHSSQRFSSINQWSTDYYILNQSFRCIAWRDRQLDIIFVECLWATSTSEYSFTQVFINGVLQTNGYIFVSFCLVWWPSHLVPDILLSAAYHLPGKNNSWQCFLSHFSTLCWEDLINSEVLGFSQLWHSGLSWCLHLR